MKTDEITEINSIINTKWKVIIISGIGFIIIILAILCYCIFY